MAIASLNLLVGWLAMLIGALSGALVGLFFHRADWLGGYGSFPRRMIRLGHIACFGMGFVNVLFALSAGAVQIQALPLRAASALFVVAAIAMPTLCFLTAWRKRFRLWFGLPVSAVVIGIICLVLGSR